jgi:hypothetical protein
MPILPFDYPEPYALTLGIMLYPGADEVEQCQAKGFASHYVREYLPLIYRVGLSLSNEELNRVLDDATDLFDLRERWLKGTMTGEMFRVFLALAHTEPVLATWANVMRLIKVRAAKHPTGTSETNMYAVRKQFGSVAHLWAAWMIRHGEFQTDLGLRGSGDDEFQSFLAESEVLRDWGQTWRHKRGKAEPPLPLEIWRVPNDWQPPAEQTGWAQTGEIPHLEWPQEHVSQLRKSGRPRK